MRADLSLVQVHTPDGDESLGEGFHEAHLHHARALLEQAYRASEPEAAELLHQSALARLKLVPIAAQLSEAARLELKWLDLSARTCRKLR